MSITLINEAFQHALSSIAPASADLIVTSPPYKSEDGYTTRLMEEFGAFCAYALKPTGRVFFNFGQLKENFARPLEAAVFIAHTDELIQGQTIIWVKSIAIDGDQKGHYQPLNSNQLLNYCWEYVFTFHKHSPRALNRLAIGVPFKDKTNLTRGTRGENGDCHCKGDVWFIPYSTTGATEKKKHPYEYPEELVRHCLLVGGQPGDTVIDPFGGSGTTAVVARSLGMSCISLEKDPVRHQAAVNRVHGV